MNTKIAKKVLMKNFYNSEFSSTKYAKIIGDIYHYTSVDGIIGILKNKELWFTNIYFLNDNQELFYTYKLINEVVKEIKNDLWLKSSNKSKPLAKLSKMFATSCASSIVEIWFCKLRFNKFKVDCKV